MIPIKIWQPEEINEVGRLWADEGLPASRIGERFGVSRSAILGMINRRGLKRSPEITAKNRASNGDLSRQPGSRRAKQRERAALRLQAPSKPVALKPAPIMLRPAPAPPAPPMTHATEPDWPAIPRLLDDLLPRDCRWPLWPETPGKLYCGGRAHEGGSYCPAHAAMAYRAANTVHPSLRKILLRNGALV